MKKKTLLSLGLVLALSATFFASACKPKDEIDPNYATNANYIELDDYKSYLKHDLKILSEAIGTVDATVDAKVAAAKAAGESAIDAATDVKSAKAEYKTASEAMADAVPAADGVYNFSGLTAEQKTEILGKVEGYSIRNGMLGVTLYENGGYVMYNERITLGTENYIVGYGFGTLAEGSINADLDAESNAAWKRYYHTYESSNPGTINYLNDQGSQVGDLYGYMGASYYTNFMNETKDGYNWVPELAVGDPVPVGGLDENGQAATWRFELRKGLKYNTNSKLADRKAFDGREVELEDFLTPYKLLLNQANGLYRGGEMANQTGAAAIKGAKAYYDSTKNAGKGVSDADFSGVGVKVEEADDGKWYLEYTMGAPVTMFYARYYVSSSLYMPVPESFVNLVGVDYYLSYNEDKTTTPVDNALSLGAYTLEEWDSQQIVFKKNPYYVFASTKYAISGIHVNVLSAASTDKEAAMKEFLAGKLDSCGIPDTYLEKYSSDPRAKTTAGDSCLKLNMNALDQETWIKLFGRNGSYSQTTEENYWTVEPALSNSHFRLGLSYSLDRLNFANVKGSVPSLNYFSSNYMSDPEKGISYNSTQAHKDAMKTLTECDNAYGYDLELARDYFRIALDELEADGLIKPGLKSDPTVIKLEVAWFTPAMQEGYHKYVKQYWESAFNDESVTGGRYKLQCDFWCGETYNDCYDKILTGQFDIGFGSITGNPLDPLSFFNVNSTDPSISNDFTLNWAIDTATLTEALVYNGKRWSFDALYQATQGATIVNKGKLEKAYELGDVDYEKKDDGSYEVTVTLKNHVQVEKLDLAKLVIFGGDNEETYKEWALAASTYTVSYDAEADTLTVKVTVPAEEVQKVPAAYNQGLDLYFTYTLGGTPFDAIVSAYVPFE